MLEAKADDDLDYLKKNCVKDYNATEGNKGVLVLRRLHERKDESLLISLWDSIEVIRRFSGDEIDKAVYYPEDRKFLLAFDLNVEHNEVLFDSDAE